MKISWLILTMNRVEKVSQSVMHNLANLGDVEDPEIVWVDNGSKDGVREFMFDTVDPEVAVLHAENQGVAKGYNRAMALASGDYLVITGCDMLMPPGWLETFKKYVSVLPGTAVACMYSKPLDECVERSLEPNGRLGGGWKTNTTSKLPWMPALPMERRIFSRSFLSAAGYLREDFGLYGWEDVEWANRAARVARASGLITYVIPDQVPIHLGTEGIDTFKTGGDDAAYHAFKREQARDPDKFELLKRCGQNGWPYYNPYV